jgi:glycosyltransferase involved in cell wall biosynthesis
LDALLGVVLKLVGITRQSIYYVIDYVPNRFTNKTMNSLYHRIEKIAAHYSNWTWNLSPRMIEARERKWQETFAHQLVVPHGVHSERIKRVPFSKVHQHEIIFMGTLLKKQGVQLVIEAIPLIRKKIPDVSFTVIGDGPYRPSLEKLTDELAVRSHVTFLGYLEDHRDVENRIAQAAIAVALYNKTDDDFSHYADPGKIRNYLGAGVPVLVTDVPYVAREVEEKKCGMIVTYDTYDITRVVISLLNNKKMLKQYRENAVSFAQSFRWEHLFSTALSHLDLLQ